jgi:hypothetical protein
MNGSGLFVGIMLAFVTIFVAAALKRRLRRHL